jgi:hypothetical protein
MKKHHGGTHHIQGVLENRGTEPRPSPTHGGSGKSKGVTHAAPPAGGTVNDQNYGGQKVKRK